MLSPAGNRESFCAAVDSGANAVYLGLKDFSARKNAGNFTIEELADCVRYAELFDVKVYVAVNTLVKDEEVRPLLRAVGESAAAGVHAFILQDAVLGKKIKALYPELTLHLSTQAGINNRYGAELAKQYGFSRVILARETALQDISEISQIIETEAFIQGALCTSFSGQCYMSSLIGGNSGNRGLCKQPCRKQYAYYENGKRLTEGYSLSLADLSVGREIGKLIEAGVTSFKIEGRLRSAEYVSAATEYYRNILDGKNPEESYRKLRRAFNRGNYTKGLAFGQDSNLISAKTPGHIGETVGTVFACDKHELRFRSEQCGQGDCFKILRGGAECGNGVVRQAKNGICIARYSGSAAAGDEIAVTSPQGEKKEKKCLPLAVRIRLLAGEHGEFIAESKGITYRVETAHPLEPAINAEIREEDVVSCFQKTDRYPFRPEIKVETEHIFLPKSTLNACRRELYEKVFNGKNHNKKYNDFIVNYDTHNQIENHRLAVIVNHPAEMPAAVTDAIFAPDDYADQEAIERFLSRASGCEKYLYLPAFFNCADAELLKRAVKDFEGFYAENLSGAELARACGKKCFLGTGCNFTNGISLNAFEKAAVSREIDLKSAARYEKNYAFTLGKIPVMLLIYCPFGKRCNNCGLGHRLELKDGENRKYAVRRYRLTTCRFEIYNPQDLVADSENIKSRLYDFRLYGENLIKELFAVGDQTEKLKKLLPDHTAGNTVRGMK